jgi:hypothetical protein
MRARLQVAVPIAIGVAVVALFITRVLVPDPSKTVVTVVALIALLVVVCWSAYIQNRRGLRGRSRR